MANLAKLCLALAVLAFVLAVIAAFTGPFVVSSQAYSRAANNLALIALGLFVGFKEKTAAS